MQNNAIEKVLTQGFLLEFGVVFERAFDNYKKIAVTGGVVILLLSLLFIALLFGIIGVFAGAASFTDFATSFNILDFSTVGIVLYLLFSCVVNGIIYPIYAGLLNMAHKAQQGKNIEIGDAFEFYKSTEVKELIIAGFTITLLGSGLNTLMQSFEVILIGALINYIIIFLTILTVPLIIYSKLNAFDALQTSVQLVLKSPFTIFGLVFIGYILACLGFIGLCIGIFFTLPFMISILYHIYIGILPIKITSEIDEIGISQE